MSKPTINHTYDLMLRAHEGQTRKGGKPFHIHPRAVYTYVKETFSDVDEDTLHAALLHDVIEDCPEYTYEHLRRCGYSEKTIEIVRLLTKEHNANTYMQDIQALIDTGNIDAIRVKWADTKHNHESCVDLPDDWRWVEDRYKRANELLAKALGL